MKGFRFRLEPVLGVREFSLERARLGLAGAVQTHEVAVIEEARANEDARRSESSLSERLRAGLDAREARAGAAALDDVRARAREASERRAAARARVEEERARVRDAHRAVRSLEILREQAFAAWQAEWRRREQRELDEVAIERARRAAEARP